MQIPCLDGKHRSFDVLKIALRAVDPASQGILAGVLLETTSIKQIELSEFITKEFASVVQSDLEELCHTINRSWRGMSGEAQTTALEPSTAVSNESPMTETAWRRAFACAIRRLYNSTGKDCDMVLGAGWTKKFNTEQFGPHAERLCLEFADAYNTHFTALGLYRLHDDGRTAFDLLDEIVELLSFDCADCLGESRELIRTKLKQIMDIHNEQSNPK